MIKYILSLLALIVLWSCESNPKHIDTIKIPIKEEPAIVLDSLPQNNKDIDSIWLQSDFDSAVAVILDGSHQIMYDMLKMDKKFSASIKRKLNDIQLKLMIENLSGKVPTNYTPSDCFQPYHGIFFYKKSKIKARLAICFSCRTYFSQPKNNGGINYQSTKQVFQNLGLPIYNWDDSTEVQNSKIKYSDYF